MKFEKINKDKIKVTLNNDDLSANDIDLHSFMADSEETRSLFLDVLEKAEKDYGFSTKNYSLKVETVALSNGNFILTITREIDKLLNNACSYPKKLHVARKFPKIDTASIVYKFNSFEDFCRFSNALCNNKIINYKTIAKNATLYSYNNCYYLTFVGINIKSKQLKNVFSLITEFGTYVNCSDIFIAKLYEDGNVIFKTKAIQNCIKYFI